MKLWKRPQNVRKWTVAAAGKADGACRQSGRRRWLRWRRPTKRSSSFPHRAGGASENCAEPAEAVTALEFSADGKRLYAGSLDKSWRAWTVADGTARGSVDDACGNQRLASNKDGTELFTGGADGVIRCWS